jgi:hypothetical protein
VKGIAGDRHGRASLADAPAAMLAAMATGTARWRRWRALLAPAAVLALGGCLETVSERDYQDRTVGDMEAIVAALDRYRAARGCYPEGPWEAAAAELERGGFLDPVPRRDAWQEELRYRPRHDDGGRVAGYTLASCGADRQCQGGDAEESFPFGPLGQDLVVRDGIWVHRPPPAADLRR